MVKFSDIPEDELPLLECAERERLLRLNDPDTPAKIKQKLRKFAELTLPTPGEAGVGEFAIVGHEGRILNVGRSEILVETFLVGSPPILISGQGYRDWSTNHWRE